MIGDSYNVVVAEGGFIVHANKNTGQTSDQVTLQPQSYEPRVFADSSSLINYLHNELAGSK